MAKRRQIQTFNNVVIFKQDTYPVGIHTEKLTIQNGSRIVVTMIGTNVPVGSQAILRVKSNFTEAVPAFFLEESTITTNTETTLDITRFHNFVDVEVEVLGASVDLVVGISVYENNSNEDIVNIVNTKAMLYSTFKASYDSFIKKNVLETIPFDKMTADEINQYSLDLKFFKDELQVANVSTTISEDLSGWIIQFQEDVMLLESGDFLLLEDGISRLKL